MSKMLFGVVIFMSCFGMSPVEGMAADQPISTEKISKEARETIEATKEYTAQQKEAFQRKVNEELAVIQKQIVALRGKASDASEATRADLKKSITELEKKKDAAKNKLDELKSSTDEKWTDMKAGVNSALDELKHSYQKALSHLP